MTDALTTLDDYQGEPTWCINTPTALYYFHRTSAGFASLVDPQGRDWITFRPGDGPRGEYRGIPNLGRAEGGFHPGRPGNVTSEISIRSRDSISIRSETDDGLWATTWKVFANRAELTVERTGAPFWFLYEGTPGGDYDESTAYLVDSTGHRMPANELWERRLPDPRWVYFAAPPSPYALVVWDRTPRPADTVDQYWSMEQAMTVFGFGRTVASDSGRWMHLTRTPSHFAVAMMELTDHDTMVRKIAALAED